MLSAQETVVLPWAVLFLYQVACARFYCAPSQSFCMSLYFRLGVCFTLVDMSSHHKLFPENKESTAVGQMRSWADLSKHNLEVLVQFCKHKA